MSDVATLDRAYDFILRRLVAGGDPPHYVELATAFDLEPENGKALLHELMSSGIPGWLAPGTDYIASFAPFNVQPTHYRISVDGQRKGYGQWGFESLAVCWLYPGQTVTVDAFCLDCGESLRVQVRDGEILSADPPTIHAFIDLPWSEWRKNLAYSWSRMNLFRSEEHAKRWSGYRPESAAGLRPLKDMMAIFSGRLFRERLNGRYLTDLKALGTAQADIVSKVTGGDPFWRRK
jgi:hypothetical protein